MGDPAVDRAVEAASKDAGFVTQMGDRLALGARASTVFGDPVERDGITVIPVARATWGFGGGSGGNDLDSGRGGGGGAKVHPIGYIEVREGEARFVRIRDPQAIVATLAPVAGALAWALYRRRGR